MQYVREFQLPPDFPEQHERLIEYEKKNSYFEIGRMIGENIGFEEYLAKSESWTRPDEQVEFRRFKIMVQAFSQKDWAEFKHKVFNMMFNGLLVLGTGEVKALFAELESISSMNKPEPI